VFFTPDAEVVHVGGASHGGRLYRENIRSHVRFFAKHHGRREAERARRLILAGVRIRARVYRGERRAMYADAARWLRSKSVAELLEEPR